MRKFIRTILTIVIVCAFYLPIDTQAKKQINFNNISIEDGLSQATVETMMQDSKGYIWFGTNDGLDRYNGYTFKKYSYEKGKENSLVNNYILDIKEDNEGNIWVATAAGISKILSDGESIKNYTSDKEKGNLSNDNTASILISSNNTVYVGTAKGINVYNKERDDFNLIYPELKDEYINSLAEDSNGDIWAGTENGLYKINYNDNVIEKFEASDNDNSISENYIYKVYYDNNGYIWIGTYNNGFCKINIENNEITRYLLRNEDNSVRGGFVKNFLKDSKGNLWVCTDDGLVLLNVKTNEVTWYENKVYDALSLIDNDTFSIMEDSKGLIWIGTYAGVSSFDPYNKIEHYKHDPFNKNTINENAVSGIYQDKNGLLWIGTASSGVNILNKEKDVIANLNTLSESVSLSNDRISDITGFGDYVFIATYNGLNVYNEKTKEIEIYKEENGLSSNSIKKLYYDDLGYLWIGSNLGLDILDINNRKIINLNEMLDNIGIINKYISAIYKDSKGNYWIGTFIDDGIIRIDPEKNTVSRYGNIDGDNSSLSDNAVRCINEDAKGQIWIGTSFGLNKYNEEENNFTTYTTKEGLANNTIYGILFDGDNNPWVSTNLGISKININSDVISNLNITDGLQSNEFNGNSYYKTANGEFLFGGINGFNLFDPNEVIISDKELDIIFDEFEVNGSHIDKINNESFKYTENNIRITFFLPNYKSMKNIQYYYTLNEEEEGWILLKNNYVNLANLAPGKYILKVRARSNDGTISDAKQISFTILQPLWKSKKAIIVYIFIILLIVIYNKYKMNSLDKMVFHKTRQLSDEMERNTKLLNKVIDLERKKNNYFINLSHELRTPLNVIYSTEQLIRELNKDGIPKGKLDYYMNILRKNTERLLKMINDIIDTSKIENDKYHLNIKENDIVYLVEESVLSLKEYIEAKGVSLIIDPEIEEKKIKCDYEAIERCIINLVSNAGKFSNAGDTITVKIEELKDEVRIKVIDTGIGIEKKYHETIFNRFNQVIDENSEKKGGSGLGLTITRQIIELHNGEIYVESEIGKGSTFTIILPVNI